MERDLDRELRYHMDRRVDDLMKNGSSEAEARRQASIEFGGVAQVQEEVRDTWIWRWLDALVRDVRYAIRSLTKSWGFALGAGAVLALAIGANIAIFSVVNTVLLQPLPYPDAERIVSVETFWTNTGRASQDVSGPDFLDWQAQNDVFEKMAVYYGGDDFATIVGDRALFANARYVSADFFAVFGQTASAGRLLTEHDVPAGDAEPTVAVVRASLGGGALRQRRGRDREDDHGVRQRAGDRRRGGAGISLSRRHGYLGALAHPRRREPQPSQLPRRRETQGRSGPHACAGPDADHRRHPRAPISGEPPQDRHLDSAAGAADRQSQGDVVGADERRGPRVAHRVRQHREPSAGAGRGQDARDRAPRRARRRPGPCGAATAHRELCAGRSRRASLGSCSRPCSCAGLMALSPANLPGIDDVRIDLTVLLFALGLSLVSTVLFGLVPALHASRLDLSEALKQGGSKATASRASSRLRATLVVTEVALSVILLVAAGLLVRSFQALQHVDLGFTTNRVLAAYTDYAVDD